MDDIEKQWGTFSRLHQALCIIPKPSVNSNWSYNPETINSGQNWWFSVPCDLEMWQMTLKNNKAPLLCYFKLCASFISHRSIQTWVTVRPEMPNSGQNRRIFNTCDLDIWRMTLKNNRAPLLSYFKFCAWFHRHRSFQAGVTVQKRQIRVKIGDFLSRVTLKFDGWPWKTIGHLSNAISRIVHHFIAIGLFKLELQSGNAKFGSKSAIFCPVWPWNFTDDFEKQ